MGREQLAGWGGTAPSVADVIYPADSSAAAAVVAKRPPRGVIARGLGRSYGDAAQNAGGTVVTTTSLDGFEWVERSHGEGTGKSAGEGTGEGIGEGIVRVAAGTSLDSLMRRLVPEGWFVPVTPGTRQVTVGGAFAADIHGKNHHRDGSFAAHVSAFTLATPAGVTTVTPVSDPELFWATAGGMGLTGVILDVTLRLLAVPTAWVRVVTARAGDLDGVMAAMAARDSEHRYSVAWVDGLAAGGSLGRGVITWGDHAGADEVPAQGHDALAFAPPTRLTVPSVVPSGVLNARTVGAFNRLWFHRAPARLTTTVEPLARFFHPLDAVQRWNRLYGRPGFLQYQFVVPFGAEPVVRAALERLRDLRCPSFLAVLKRFGAGNPGPLSFPQPGWTLAVDIPGGGAGGPGVSEALDRLDDLVADAGGRVYLAKDSRLRPELIGAMYPDIGRFRAVKARVDPDGVFTSDLARRLGLGAG